MAFEEMNPPGNITGHVTPLEAPATCGSFLNELEPLDREILEHDAKLDYEFDHPESTWLPPRKFRRRVEPFETPLNSLGLVDSRKLIEQVLSTIDPAYDWRPMRGRHKSIHHLQWPEAWYSREKDETGFSPASFRDLALNKCTMPREFENWLHVVSLPPRLPEEEVMRGFVESWKVNHGIFKACREVVLWERRTERLRDRDVPLKGYKQLESDDSDALECLANIVAKRSRGLERQLNDLERIPQEFRLVEPINNPSDLGKMLGKFVMPRALPVIHVVRHQTRLAQAA